MGERECVWNRVCERERVKVREREREWNRVCERESVWEKERENEIECARESERER